MNFWGVIPKNFEDESQHGIVQGMLFIWIFGKVIFHRIVALSLHVALAYPEYLDVQHIIVDEVHDPLHHVGQYVAQDVHVDDDIVIIGLGIKF